MAFLLFCGTAAAVVLVVVVVVTGVLTTPIRHIAVNNTVDGVPRRNDSCVHPLFFPHPSLSRRHVIYLHFILLLLPE